MMVTAVGLNSAQGQILGSISGAAPSAPGDGLRCAATPCFIGKILLAVGLYLWVWSDISAGRMVPTC